MEEFELLSCSLCYTCQVVSGLGSSGPSLLKQALCHAGREWHRAWDENWKLKGTELRLPFFCQGDILPKRNARSAFQVRWSFQKEIVISAVRQWPAHAALIGNTLLLFISARRDLCSAVNNIRGDRPLLSASRLIYSIYIYIYMIEHEAQKKPRPVHPCVSGSVVRL